MQRAQWVSVAVATGASKKYKLKIGPINVRNYLLNWVFTSTSKLIIIVYICAALGYTVFCAVLCGVHNNNRHQLLFERLANIRVHIHPSISWKIGSSARETMHVLLVILLPLLIWNWPFFLLSLSLFYFRSTSIPHHSFISFYCCSFLCTLNSFGVPLSLMRFLGT